MNVVIEDKKHEKIRKPWKSFPNPEFFKEEKEMSYQPNWFKLPKDGGRDIDLADYSNGR